MKISLKVVIAGLLALAVLVSTAVTLYMIYSTALSAVTAIARNHAIVLGGPTQAASDEYIAQVADAMRLIANTANDTGSVLPIDDDPSTWMRRWTIPLRHAVMFANGAFPYARIAFADGSAAASYYEPYRPTVICMYATDGRTLSGGSGATRSKECYEYSNYQMIQLTGSDPTLATNTDTADSRTSYYYTSLAAATTRNPTPGAVSLYDFPASGNLVVGIPFHATLRNASNHVLGLGTIVVNIDTLGVVVRSLKATARSVGFLVDATGMVLASSDPAYLTTTTTANASLATSIPNGCVSTKLTQVRSAPATVSWTCLSTAGSSNYGPLSNFAATLSTMPTGVTTSLTLLNGGETFYVSVSAINGTVLGALSLRFVLFLPESDILNEIVVARDVVIGVAAGLFVLFVGLASGLIALLLSPLHVIAYRMRLAASLDDDEDRKSVSRLKEVAEIEQAYYEMNDQLLHIRQFVPASVLVTAQDDEDDDDDEGDVAARSETERSRQSGQSGHTGHSSGASGRSGQSGSHRSGSRRESNAMSAASGSRSRRVSMSVSQQQVVGTTARSVKYLEAGQTGTQLAAASARSARHMAIKQLNLVASLTNVRCSVLALDLKGFHEYTRRVTADVLIAGFNKTVATILRTVNAEKGVIDSFQGDHFVFSFAAVRPAAAHSKRATLCGLRICEELATQGFQLEACCGVSMGLALAGNVGCADNMRFNVIGALVQQASLLARMCRIYDAAVMVPSVVLPDLETHVNTVVVDIVRLPGTQRPCSIAKATEELNKSDEPVNEEWLYIVGGNVNASELRNKAFEDLQRGDISTAADVVKRWQEEAGQDDSDPLISKLIRFMQSEPEARCTPLGRYYDCFLQSDQQLQP